LAFIVPVVGSEALRFFEMRNRIGSFFLLVKIFAERNFGYYTIRNIFDRSNITADIDYKTDIVGGLQKVIDGEADAWQRGIPTTRRSSGLAVWMALRAHGWRTIRAAVNSNIELTRMLELLLAERGFRILEGGELSVACARWEPPDQTAEAIDRLQNVIALDVVSSGKAWFSTTRHAGRTWLRFNMVNLYTREHHVRQLADILRSTADHATREESKWKR